MRRTAFLVGLLLGLGAGAAQAEDQVLTKDQILKQLLGGGTRAISKRQRTSVNLPTVTFEFNSATLTQQGKRQLDELADALLEGHLAQRKIVIAGHTDSTGSDGYNMLLSERRAAAARDYLVGQHRLDTAQLDAIGFGEARPLPDQPTTASGQRRVEVVIDLTS